MQPTDLEIQAPPWDYNPSSWRQRGPVCAVAALGFLVATYMALYQWRLIDSVWDPVFGTQTQSVLDSDVSERMRSWIGIPDAALGALAYLGDLLYGLAGSTRRWQYRPWMVLLFGFDVIPLGVVSVILVVLQGTVVGAWCFLCLCTAAISILLIWLAWDEIWSTLVFLRDVWRRERSWPILWSSFWGRPTAVATIVAER